MEIKKPLFVLPALFSLSGTQLNSAEDSGDSCDGKAAACSGGCTNGCGNGCNTGSGGTL